MSLLALLGKAIITVVFTYAVHVLASMILCLMHALGMCPLIGPISQVAFSHFIAKLVAAILLAAVGRNFPQVAAAAGYVYVYPTGLLGDPSDVSALSPSSRPFSTRPSSPACAL